MNLRSLAFIFALSAICAFAAQPSQSPSPTAGQPAPATKPDTTQDAKVQALQSELQVMRDFTQHILSTVYWSLGVILVVLFTMIGFGWYQNFRAFERDKEALRVSLSETLRQDLSTKAVDLEQKLSEGSRAIEKKVSDAIREAHHRISSVDLYAHAEIFGVQARLPLHDINLLHFIMMIGRYSQRVSPDELSHALQPVLSYVESQKAIDPTIRTPILNLLERLPRDCKAMADRIREALDRLPIL